MILGNSLNGTSLGLNSFTDALVAHRDRVEMVLAIGGTRWEAARQPVQHAVRTGMIPIINTMMVVGVVSLPGMMTGQLLSGTSPLEAVKYQIVIMFLIAAATALARKVPLKASGATRTGRLSEGATVRHPRTGMASEETTIEAAGRDVRITSPSKELFPAHGGRPAITKLDLVRFYVDHADAVLLGVRERPTVLKRWNTGITGKPFFNKRVQSPPDWLQTATVSFPSGGDCPRLL